MKLLKIISFILLIVLSLGALAGGYFLLSDPSGAKFEFPLDLLEGTPFNNYLVPGIILLVVNGLLPVLVFIAIVRKIRLKYIFLSLQGLLLIGWLSVELFINSDFFVPHLHYPFYAIGIMLMVAGMLLHKRDKK